MTEDGAFAAIRFEGTARSEALFDYCDRRARQATAARGQPAGKAGRTGLLWYLWCGAKSPLFAAAP